MSKRRSGTGNATLQAIARRCHVAKSTVSLAMRGDPRVQPRTAARIRAAAQKLGYDPAHHETARRLALGKYGTRAVSKVIGLLCPTGAYRFLFYARLLQGLLEGFTPAEFNVVAGSFVRHPNGNVEPETSLQHLISRGDLDALIFYSDEKTFRPVLQHIRRNSGFGERPALSLLFPAASCSSVVADEEEGARQATEHLLLLGHRHILLFSIREEDSDGPAIVARWQGVRRGLMAHGHDPARHLHFVPLPRPWVDPVAAPHALGEMESAPAADGDEGAPLVQYLRRHPEVTAVFGQNDSAALHAWHVLHRAGLRIPDDISIVGFDDTDPMLDQSGRNLLTTVRLPLLEIGRRAAQVLTQRVLGELDSNQDIVLPAEFVTRMSAAPPRRTSPD